MGSLAGAGTLGFLISPSIILVTFGVLAKTSILQLFLADIIPELMLALLITFVAEVVTFLPNAIHLGN